MEQALDQVTEASQSREQNHIRYQGKKYLYNNLDFTDKIAVNDFCPPIQSKSILGEYRNHSHGFVCPETKLQI